MIDDIGIGKWVNKIPRALLAYRTTPKQPTRENLYAFSFGVEALIPMESGLTPLRTTDTSKLSQALDELGEKRE